MAEQTGSEQLSEPAKLPGTSFSAPAPTSALTDPASAITDNDKRDLVRRISESSHLRKAPRLTELLNFLTERSISDCTVGLHEHEIGVSLFGREADYDPARSMRRDSSTMHASTLRAAPSPKCSSGGLPDK